MNDAEVDPRRLELLLELSRLGSMREVSEVMHVTTSTVSQQLAALSREAGTPLTEQTVTLPGIGPTIQLTAPGWHFASNPAAGAASWSALPPAPIGPPAFAAIARPAVAPAQPVTLTAIPYFQWDNRGPGAMRVWIPAAHAGPPAP